MGRLTWYRVNRLSNPPYNSTRFLLSLSRYRFPSSHGINISSSACSSILASGPEPEAPPPDLLPAVGVLGVAGAERSVPEDRARSYVRRSSTRVAQCAWHRLRIRRTARVDIAWARVASVSMCCCSYWSASSCTDVQLVQTRAAKRQSRLR